MLGRPSQPDALDLIECQAFLGPVIELGGAGAFVRGHRLCVLERTSILQIRRDPGRTEGMAADRGLDAGGGGAPAHHAPGVGLGLWLDRKARRHSSLWRYEAASLYDCRQW